MAIKEQYEALRRKLIDTSLRNRMLNHSLSRATGVSVEGEDPDQIFEMLVGTKDKEGKKMVFTGQPDIPTNRSQNELDIDLSSEVEDFPDLAPEPPSVDRTDNKLNTPHQNKILERRLLKTWRESVAMFEETGINVLYLALGALEWKQGESEQRTYTAPLVFIPVKLEREANGRFKIEYDGGEIGDNLSLRVKLKDDFGIDLPLFEEGDQVSQYAARVAKACSQNKTWQVLPEAVVLGFFQFAKIVMYHDLQEDSWPEGSAPTANGDIKALLGMSYEDGFSGPSESENLDPYRPPAEINEIYSADSSQVLAMIRALSGQSMVIEGPPGTGKSQTIANLIAEYLGHGRKILFVSEKMAALNVVFRRLDQAGLGDACLELHSKASQRRQFYDEIKRVMGKRGELQKVEAELNQLVALRDKLNGYSQAVNDPVEPWGLTPHQAIGLSSKLPPEQAGHIGFRIPFDSVRDFPHTKVKELLPLIGSFERQLETIGVPSKHPFCECAIKVVTPSLNLELKTDLEELISRLEQASATVVQLANALCIEPIQKPSEVPILKACVQRALEAPTYDGVAIKLDSWSAEDPNIRDCIQQLTVWQSMNAKYLSQVSPTIWDADLGQIVFTLDKWAPKWYKFVSGELKLRLKELQSHLAPGTNIDAQGALLLAKDVQTAQKCRDKIKSYDSMMSRLFGAQWQGESTDPKVVEQLLSWCLDLRNAVSDGTVPKGLLDFFSAAHKDLDLRALADRANQEINDVVTRANAVAHKLQYKIQDFRESLLQDIAQLVQGWHQNLRRLHEITQFNVVRDELIDRGLSSVVELAFNWEEASQLLRAQFERCYYEGILTNAYSSRQALQGFDRNQHEEAVKQFSGLDEFMLNYNKSKVKVAHLKSLPDWSISGGNMGLVKRQCELRRGHKSIRWALETAGPAIQQMKPVFLMSPLSVAQFLPHDQVHFDVVIFDEASQVKPEDGLSAIARADQTIVVGDSKQMPPTSFFDKLSGDTEDESDDVQTVGQMESLLALMSATVNRGSNRSSDLQWHYRSLHPALIRPSNSEFYQNRLIVFPSPIRHGSEGLLFHYSATETYDRGGTRKNFAQAQRVAKAVIKHFQTKPEETLIVVAFSKQQEEAIEDALELEYRSYPGLLSQFDQRHPFEKFDVKNLESVQGDERDVVYISVGYGADEKGFVSMSFGPVNASGGDRRLNVLMSRARKRCEVFSSIRSGDFRINENPSPGLVLLKKYLNFAETGELDDPKPTGKEEDSVFEEQVAKALRQQGLEVDIQVGSIGFFIDLAIQHPEFPGRYVLGVECDGASYHSAKSARDRDKLRQGALEARGWKIHRIWSTDWWQNPEGEVERCLAAYHAAVETYDKDSIDEANTDEPVISEPEDFIINAPPVLSESSVQPYKIWDRPFNLQGYALQNLPASAVVKCIETILAYEGPLHRDVLTTRLRKSAGLGRAGSQVRAVVNDGIDAAHRLGSIEIRGEFIYPKGWTCKYIRSVASLPSPDKKPEWVVPEEFQFALVEVVKNSYGIDREEGISNTWRHIGFSQVTKQMLTLGNDLLTVYLQKSSTLKQTNNKLLQLLST